MRISSIFLNVLDMSVTAAFVISALWVARLILKKIHAPKWISYALWIVAGFRLAVPFSFESVLSLIPRGVSDIVSTENPPNAMNAQVELPPGNFVSTDIIDNTAVLRVGNTNLVFEIAMYVWLAGIFIMLLYAVISYVRLIRHRDSVTTPFVYGFIKAKIHIPNGLEGEELRYVRVHEQTHIKRNDHIVKMLAFALLCVHWFNPFVWAAFILLCADMEMSCDEKVLSQIGISIKAEYSQTLLSLSMKRRILNASPLAFGEGGIKERVKNVLKFKKTSKLVIVAAVVLAVSLTVGLTLNRASAKTVQNIPVQATISYDGKSALIELDNKDSIPYVEIGSEISINFLDFRPPSVIVIEVIVAADGSRRYGESTDRTLEIELSGSNLLTFIVEKNWADALSSNSDDYQPGNAFRWYRIICEDGDKSVEYGLWLRTDPAVIMNIEPNGENQLGSEDIHEDIDTMNLASSVDEMPDEPYISPLTDHDQISMPFGTRIHPIEKTAITHEGIDIAAPAGTPILAVKTGTVIEAGKNDTDGIYVMLAHSAGVQTFYAHMSEYAEGLTSGDIVEQGEVIGYVGSTGISTGNHLHFGIIIDGVFIDPTEKL